MPEYADITAFYEWLNWLEEISNSSYPDHETLMFYEIRNMLDCLPKVVRCSECTHYKNNGVGGFYCDCDKVTDATDSCFFEPPHEDFYCYYGERENK